MSKEYLLDYTEAKAHLCHRLFELIGPGAYSNNYNGIIRAVVEALLHPTIDYPLAAVVQDIASLGIKPLVAREIYAELTSFLAMPINRLTNGKIGSYNYSVAIFEDYLKIIEIGPIYETEKEVDLEASVDNWIQNINKHVENGDWVPPNMRRLAGLL